MWSELNIASNTKFPSPQWHHPHDMAIILEPLNRVASTLACMGTRFDNRVNPAHFTIGWNKHCRNKSIFKDKPFNAEICRPGWIMKGFLYTKAPPKPTTGHTSNLDRVCTNVIHPDGLFNLRKDPLLLRERVLAPTVQSISSLA